MKPAVLFYLERINPVVAVFIFLWCLWIYSCPLFIAVVHHKFHWHMVKALMDGREYYIPMYILIKGVFCSLMLWIVGEYFKGLFTNKKI
jgi:hypothetical protein